VETVVLLSHKAPDSHIHVKVEFGEGKGKVSLDKIAERAEKHKPKEKLHSENKPSRKGRCRGRGLR
jgi:hypothetical protein